MLSHSCLLWVLKRPGICAPVVCRLARLLLRRPSDVWQDGCAGETGGCAPSPLGVPCPARQARRVAAVVCLHHSPLRHHQLAATALPQFFTRTKTVTQSWKDADSKAIPGLAGVGASTPGGKH